MLHSDCIRSEAVGISWRSLSGRIDDCVDDDDNDDDDNDDDDNDDESSDYILYICSG